MMVLNLIRNFKQLCTVAGLAPALLHHPEASTAVHLHAKPQQYCHVHWTAESV